VSECFFWKLRRFSRDFFYRVFELPLLRNAQKRDKKNRTKQPREKKKKTDEKKATFFCDEPRRIFSEFFPVFLNSPCCETAKKRVKKNDKK
jgi:hypothetical protein